MPRRPTTLMKFTRSVVSLVVGIMVEVVFILWLILIIFGVAALALILSNQVS